jgi:hypothetical protein
MPEQRELTAEDIELLTALMLPVREALEEWTRVVHTAAEAFATAVTMVTIEWSRFVQENQAVLAAVSPAPEERYCPSRMRHLSHVWTDSTGTYGCPGWSSPGSDAMHWTPPEGPEAVSMDFPSVRDCLEPYDHDAHTWTSRGTEYWCTSRSRPSDGIRERG